MDFAIHKVIVPHLNEIEIYRSIRTFKSLLISTTNKRIVHNGTSTTKNETTVSSNQHAFIN